MKLNKEQIQKINHILLREEKIYDKLVRLELVDHIASVLEEKDLSFEESFTKYWHSKEKVLLITNAKKQIENKKEQVEACFWKQFLNPVHFLLIVGLFYGLKSLSTSIAFENFTKGSIIVLMSLVLVLFLSIKFFSKRHYYYFKSFLDAISVFYVVSLQLSKFWIDKIISSFLYTNIFLVYISVITISFWFFYKTYCYTKTIDTIKKHYI